MSDLYTKAVLTVIALALIVIAVRDVLTPATAQAPMHVILDQVDPKGSPTSVYLSQVDRNAFGLLQYSNFPLPVKVKQ